jgi:hypothetical protein
MKNFIRYATLLVCSVLLLASLTSQAQVVVERVKPAAEFIKRHQISTALGLLSCAAFVAHRADVGVGFAGAAFVAAYQSSPTVKGAVDFVGGTLWYTTKHFAIAVTNAVFHILVSRTAEKIVNVFV